MDNESGYIRYPGILNPLRATYTLAHGITPGVVTIDCLPQQRRPNAAGDVIIAHGGTEIKIKFCVLESIEYQSNESGQTARVTLLDGRWHWKFGHISGRYNVRDGDGELIPDTKKTARELAEMCLRALRVGQFTVDGMPNDLFPEINWDFSNPAQALADICDQAGCRVVYHPDQSVDIHRAGQGAQLPRRLIMSGGQSADYTAIPDAFVVVGAPIDYQADLELEAVGFDSDGAIKPIDELSYKPEGGWGTADFLSLLEVASSKEEKRALDSIFRVYRVKIPDDGLAIPGYAYMYVDTDGSVRTVPEGVESIDQLVIQSVQVETKEENGLSIRKPAIVYGVWYDGLRVDNKNSVEDENDFGPLQDENSDAAKQQMVTAGFNLDPNRGLAIFSDRVYRRKEVDDGWERAPAILRLRTTVNVRNQETGIIQRYIRADRRQQIFNVGTRILRRDEIKAWIIPEYVGGKGFRWQGYVHNIDDCNDEAEFVIESIKSEYTVDTPQQARYAGILPIDPDGAIQSITWTASIEGGYETHASRNNDVNDYIPPYQVRRRNERVGEVVAERRAEQQQVRHVADAAMGRAQMVSGR